MTTMSDRPSCLLVTAGTILDGTGSEPIADAAALIEDGLITFAGPRSQLAEGRIPADRLDFPNGTVIPGSIDAHVHTTSPAAMQAYLAHGVTTVRYAGLGDRSGRRDAPGPAGAGAAGTADPR